METERMDITEEVYTYNEYKILDVSWSQFSESNTDRTKTIFRGKEASSGFQRAIRSQEKIIANIHYAHHWSLTVIDARERKLQTYDSMTKVGHKKDPHYTPEPPICTKTTLRVGRGIASGGLPA